MVRNEQTICKILKFNILYSIRLDFINVVNVKSISQYLQLLQQVKYSSADTISGHLKKELKEVEINLFEIV